MALSRPAAVVILPSALFVERFLARCQLSGLLPNIRRSNWYSPSTSTRQTQPLPASFYEHRFPLFCKTSLPPGRERRACCGYLKQGRGLSPLPHGKTTTPNCSLKHARSTMIARCMASRARGRRSRHGIDGPILETSLGSAGKVLEAATREAGRRTPQVGNTAFGAGAVQSGAAGTQERFPDAERLVKRLVARELRLSFVPDAEQHLWRTVTR